jgi:hypothetical protein
MMPEIRYTAAWDDLKVYVEVAVEKLDLRNLFEPVCEEFHVPLTNFKAGRTSTRAPP